MLRIRLQRIGRRDQPYFRVVVAEGTIKQEGKVVEIIGLYDPQKEGKDRLDVKKDRIKYWQEHGAQMSDGAMKLLLSTAEKKKIWPDKKKAKAEEQPEEAPASADKSEAKPEKAEKPAQEEPAAEAEDNGDTESAEDTTSEEPTNGNDTASEGESTETKE